MYAIIEDSGGQIKVSEGDLIEIDPRELPEDQKTIEFDQVLMIGDVDEPKIGSPLLDGAKVTGEIVREYRDEKVQVIKFKRRKNYRRNIGHRQKYLQVKIQSIQA